VLHKGARVKDASRLGPDTSGSRRGRTFGAARSVYVVDAWRCAVGGDAVSVEVEPVAPSPGTHVESAGGRQAPTPIAPGIDLPEPTMYRINNRLLGKPHATE
jgi:hypothetical protein